MYVVYIACTLHHYILMEPFIYNPQEILAQHPNECKAIVVNIT